MRAMTLIAIPLLALFGACSSGGSGGPSSTANDKGLSHVGRDAFVGRWTLDEAHGQKFLNDHYSKPQPHQTGGGYGEIMAYVFFRAVNLTAPATGDGAVSFLQNTFAGPWRLEGDRLLVRGAEGVIEFVPQADGTLTAVSPRNGPAHIPFRFIRSPLGPAIQPAVLHGTWESDNAEIVRRMLADQRMMARMSGQDIEPRESDLDVKFPSATLTFRSDGTATIEGPAGPSGADYRIIGDAVLYRGVAKGESNEPDTGMLFVMEGDRLFVHGVPQMIFRKR